MKVSEIMTPDPLTVDATDTLNDVIGVLEGHDIRHLPVLRKGRVAG